MTKTQLNVLKVLERIGKAATEDDDIADMYSCALEMMLDGIHEEDGFGTEGQCDPRGDGRNGHFSMQNVEPD